MYKEQEELHFAMFCTFNHLKDSQISDSKPLFFFEVVCIVSRKYQCYTY